MIAPFNHYLMVDGAIIIASLLKSQFHRAQQMFTQALFGATHSNSGNRLALGDVQAAHQYAKQSAANSSLANASQVSI
jgi:hypothetical protein